MGETVEINYYGKKVCVSREVAEYLEQSRKALAANYRKFRYHNRSINSVQGENVVLHRNNEDHLVHLVIRRIEQQEFLGRIRRLTDEQQRLFVMRYEYDMTQQEIGDRLGVSKMAVCKQLKKLQKDYCRLRYGDMQTEKERESA